MIGGFCQQNGTGDSNSCLSKEEELRVKLFQHLRTTEKANLSHTAMAIERDTASMFGRCCPGTKEERISKACCHAAEAYKSTDFWQSIPEPR